MRFGHFFYPMKFDDSRDDLEIQHCLEEAELVEALGFDAIWLPSTISPASAFTATRWCSPARWQ